MTQAGYNCRRNRVETGDAVVDARFGRGGRRMRARDLVFVLLGLGLVLPRATGMACLIDKGGGDCVQRTRRGALRVDDGCHHRDKR